MPLITFKHMCTRCLNAGERATNATFLQSQVRNRFHVVWIPPPSRNAQPHSGAECGEFRPSQTLDHSLLVQNGPTPILGRY
jgi:hypothetical protein